MVILILRRGWLSCRGKGENWAYVCCSPRVRPGVLGLQQALREGRPSPQDIWAQERRKVSAPKRILKGRTENQCTGFAPADSCFCSTCGLVEVAILASHPISAFLQHSTEMVPEFLPKLRNLNLIMRKYQRNPNCGTFYKINGLYTLKCQGRKANRKIEKRFQIEGD